MTKQNTRNRLSSSRLGRLVILWNDLEIQIRSLLLALADESKTAEILSADLEIDVVFNAVRNLAHEYDAHRKRLNTRLLIEAESRNAKVKLYEEAAAHIIYLIDCADRLLEYRNIYVHGMHSSGTIGDITIRGFNTRIPLPASSQLNWLDDLECVAAEIAALTRYAAALNACVQKNEKRNSHVRVVWPKRPPSPEKLQASRESVSDVRST
jgi:hypothetical protein